MMQTDVSSKYVLATGTVTSNRARLKGVWVCVPVATNPNPAFVDATEALTGTYTQATTTITVTIANHGFVVGQRVALALGGAGSSGVFAVATAPDANTFTVTTTVSTTISTPTAVTAYPDIGLEFGVIAAAQATAVVPGEGILFPNGIYYVGISEMTVFYG